MQVKERELEKERQEVKRQKDKCDQTLSEYQVPTHSLRSSNSRNEAPGTCDPSHHPCLLSKSNIVLQVSMINGSEIGEGGTPDTPNLRNCPTACT